MLMNAIAMMALIIIIINFYKKTLGQTTSIEEGYSDDVYFEEAISNGRDLADKPPAQQAG